MVLERMVLVFCFVNSAGVRFLFFFLGGVTLLVGFKRKVW